MSRKSSLEHGELGLKPAHQHVEETPTVVQIESFRVLGLDPDDAEFYSSYSEEKQKRVVRKVYDFYCNFAFDRCGIVKWRD